MKQQLTARELEIVRLVRRGMRNKAIAKELGISDNTVRNHIASAMTKLGVHNRTLLALART